MSGQSIGGQSSALPFDSTQTVRAVTVRELRDPNQQRWFAVQLAVSDRPVNLEAMPRFEVFGTYSLYAIQGRLGANACYALRLGFFSEQESAQAICVDLKAFYRSAAVVRVSEAEQARFKRVPGQEVPLQNPSQAGADVVDIGSARRTVVGSPTVPAQPKTRPSKPTASDTTAAPQPRRTDGATRGRKKVKSLSQELLEEARQIELARSGRHNTKQQTASWLFRLLGRSNN